ncbi:hypothetical protein B0H13DRAFT_1902655 [Mycena leptocephala]|nr:hypothetical protein B0H13DRAFT_1902655 [Mycena leptocephala]
MGAQKFALTILSLSNERLVAIAAAGQENRVALQICRKRLPSVSQSYCRMPYARWTLVEADLDHDVEGIGSKEILQRWLYPELERSQACQLWGVFCDKYYTSESKMTGDSARVSLKSIKYGGSTSFSTDLALAIQYPVS